MGMYFPHLNWTCHLRLATFTITFSTRGLRGSQETWRHLIGRWSGDKWNSLGLLYFRKWKTLTEKLISENSVASGDEKTHCNETISCLYVSIAGYTRKIPFYCFIMLVFFFFTIDILPLAGRSPTSCFVLSFFVGFLSLLPPPSAPLLLSLIYDVRRPCLQWRLSVAKKCAIYCRNNARSFTKGVPRQ